MSNGLDVEHMSSSDYLFIFDLDGLSPGCQNDSVDAPQGENKPVSTSSFSSSSATRRKRPYQESNLYPFNFPCVRLDPDTLSFVPWKNPSTDTVAFPPTGPMTPTEFEEGDSPTVAPLPQPSSSTSSLDAVEEGECVDGNPFDRLNMIKELSTPSTISLSAPCEPTVQSMSLSDETVVDLEANEHGPTTASPTAASCREQSTQFNTPMVHPSELLESTTVPKRTIKPRDTLLIQKTNTMDEKSSTVSRETLFPTVDVDSSSPSSLQRTDVEEIDQEGENNAECPETLECQESLELNVLKSVKQLVVEEIDRECTWSLWVLQENLGDQFPLNLKRITEPGLSCRPLRSLRYTSFAESLVEVPSFWIQRCPSVEESHERFVLSQDALEKFRSMMSYPTFNTKKHQFSTSLTPPSSAWPISFCRYCCSGECTTSKRFRCWKARCARCCREGHTTQRCYQDGPEKWISRFLVPFNEDYFKSLKRRLLNVTCKRFYPVSCLMCYDGGHSLCFTAHSSSMLVNTTTKTKRFPMLSCQELLDRLGPLCYQTRWDHDSAPFHRHSSASRSRYSVSSSHEKRKIFYHDVEVCHESYYGKSRHRETKRSQL